MSLLNIEKKWEQVKPYSYTWLQDLIFRCESKWQEESHFAVLVQEEKKLGQKKLQIDAVALDEKLKENLLEQIERSQVKAGAVASLMAEGSVYHVFYKTKLEVSEYQKETQVGLDMAKYLKKYKLKNLVICEGAQFSALNIFEGYAQGCYELNSFKNKKENSRNDLPEEVVLLGSKNSEQEVEQKRTLLSSLAMMRTIKDAPPNWLDSECLALLVEEIFAGSNAEFVIRGRKELEDLKMGAYLSVGAGSIHEPKFIELRVKGEDSSKTITLVGKGVTFDTGGLSLKPPASMEDMKYDMSGAASVFATAFYFSKIKPPCNVVCLIGGVENLIGPTATKPGAVVQSYSGKTIEILNTDAEGRLVLADLLSYASREIRPDLMIDVATLTGAVLIALGSCGSALFANNDNVCRYVLERSQEMGEPLAQLPIWPEIKKELKSSSADLKNIASPSVKAGTIVAAAFLREFVGNVPWAHLDICGTAWNNKVTGLPTSGSSGFILRTLINCCLKFNSFKK